MIAKNTKTNPPSPPISAPIRTSRLYLSPAWVDRLAAVPEQKPQETAPVWHVPKSAQYYCERIVYVRTADEAQAMLELALQRPLSAIGVDFEFKYTRPGVLMKRIQGKEFSWHDPRSIHPLLMSIALVEPPASGSTNVYRFVIDVRQDEVLGPLKQLLRLPVPWVAHFAQSELFCLWQLGLLTPEILWDTWAAEKALCLGLYHPRYQNKRSANEHEKIEAEEKAKEEAERSMSLVASCSRHGVDHPFALNKTRLQKSFLDHADGQPFSSEQIEYAVADAVTVVQLYPAQIQAVVGLGCMRHLETVEMPWAVTNARVIWDGVRVDAKKAANLKRACKRHVEVLGAELAGMGIDNPRSPLQVQDFFAGQGLLDCFRKGKKYTFDDAHLEAAEDRHPAIRKIRNYRKSQRLLSDKILTDELIGVDGRLHPEHRQLGGESGRNSVRWPNVAGVGRALRPLIVPDPGYAIGEVDLSQIEVGVAAAVYGDAQLIDMFNGRDVYVAMTKQYYAEKLPAGAQALPDSKFKKVYGPYRDEMKVFTLATIYGMKPHGLAILLNISEEQAAREQDRFMAMFPELTRALESARRDGAMRGCAYLCSGLRRQRPRTGPPASWEGNWLANTPVQGSASVVFKVAGNRLMRRYQHYDARLIMPLHDAFIFECPKRHLQTVAKITAEVMRGTVQEYFPQLDPRADINIDHPGCWNKDGHHRSLERWMINPELAFA